MLCDDVHVLIATLEAAILEDSVGPDHVVGQIDDLARLSDRIGRCHAQQRKLVLRQLPISYRRLPSLRHRRVEKHVSRAPAGLSPPDVVLHPALVPQGPPLESLRLTFGQRQGKVQGRARHAQGDGGKAAGE